MTLKEEVRGFEHTSLGLSIFIQPEPLLNDLSTLYVDNGFVERILFLVQLPTPKTTKENLLAEKKLNKDYKNKDLLPRALLETYRYHKDKTVTYRLDKDSLDSWCEWSDETVEAMKKLYDSDSGTLINCFNSTQIHTHPLI